MSSISSPIAGGGGGGENLSETLIIGGATGAASGIFFSDGDGANFASSSTIAFSSTTSPFGIKDLGISRISAGTLGVGDGTQGSPAGILQASSVQASNGSATAPAISFISNTNTGMYTDGVSLFMAVGGSQKLSLSSVGLLTVTAMRVNWNQSYSSVGVGSYGAYTPWNAAQTLDGSFLTTGTVSNSLIFCEGADSSFDFSHPLQTNPTIFIHSANASTTEWLSFLHNQTNGVIEVGTGSILFNNNILLQDGSVGAPSLAFANYPDMGIRVWGTNEMAFHVLGIDKMQIGTGAVTFKANAVIQNSIALQLGAVASLASFFSNSTATKGLAELGTTNGGSDGHLSLGAVSLGITTKTAAYTNTSSDHTILADATAGVFSVTLLPAATAGTGAILNIKKIDSSANAITVDADGTETIDGALTQVLAAQFDKVSIQSDGVSSWYII